MAKSIVDRAQEEITKATGYFYTAETKQKALTMYLHLYSAEEIAKKLDLEVITVREWFSTGKFTCARSKLVTKLYGNLYSRRKKDVEEVIGMGLGVLKRHLAALLSSPEQIGIPELQKIMSILADANKMLRLEEGKPTDITKSISMKEAKAKIRKIFSDDPFEEFTDIVDMEVSEANDRH